MGSLFPARAFWAHSGKAKILEDESQEEGQAGKPAKQCLGAVKGTGVAARRVKEKWSGKRDWENAAPERSR